MIHGGDTEGFRAEYGYEPLDFSSNINPLGMPESVVRRIQETAARSSAYPDPLCRKLTRAIAERERVPDSYVMCGGGAADLIWRVALALRPQRAVVTAPAFREYEAALTFAGCAVRRHTLLHEDGFAVTERILNEVSNGAWLVFLCNPNNPTGLTIPPDLPRRIAERCADNGVWLVVDECFNGFLDEPGKHTLKDLLPDNPRLIIINAFTKLYGMAGIRLGYCLCSNHEAIQSLYAAGPPWHVSSVAQEAGIAALDAHEYIETSRRLVQTERAWLRGGLASIGITEVAGEANYLFFRSDNVTLDESLRREGILIRSCANFEGLSRGYYRVAVRTHRDNIHLVEAARRILDGTKQEGASRL